MTCIGDLLQGPVWDKIRELRLSLTGIPGEPLNAGAVPLDLSEVLSLASLFSTGEETLWDHFAEALDDNSRSYLSDQIDRHREAIDALIRSDPPELGAEVGALLDLTRMYDFFVMYDWRRAPTVGGATPPELSAEELETQRVRIEALARDLNSRIRKRREP